MFMTKYSSFMFKNSAAAPAAPPRSPAAMAAGVLVVCFAFNFVARGVGDTYMVFLLPLEREFVQKNEFRVAFQPFDWRLNDLTGGRVD